MRFFSALLLICSYILMYPMSESGYLLLMDLLIIAEWSRELDELRAAFARSLDYLKQDVEESRYLT